MGVFGSLLLGICDIREGKNCHFAFGQFHGCRRQHSDICDQNLGSIAGPVELGEKGEIITPPDFGLIILDS